MSRWVCSQTSSIGGGANFGYCSSMDKNKEGSGRKGAFRIFWELNFLVYIPNRMTIIGLSAEITQPHRN